MRALFFLALVGVVAVLGACSSGGHNGTSTSSAGAGGHPGTGGSETGTGGHPGTGGGETGTGGGAPHIVIGATDAMLDVPFTVSAAGAGTKAIGQIALTNGVGTVEIDGQEVQAAVYEQQPFGMYTLYQTLAVSPGRIDVLWLYCNAGVLDFVYHEGTDGTGVIDEPATGTCTASSTASVEQVTFPAVDMAYPPLLTGYTVTGAEVSIPSGMPGSVTVGGTMLTVLAFNAVDCSTGCGTPGWYEIHSLIWDPKVAKVTFAIFYLFPSGMPVEVEYALTLPDLSDLVPATTFTATFTTP
jgi:hypothetical protein